MKEFPNLEDLAKNLNSGVETATDISFSTNALPGIGPERELIGKIFSLKQGDMSQPVKGTKGVFVVKIDNVTEANLQGADLKPNAQQLLRALQSRVDYEVFTALQEEAKIKDNRGKFY